jgi:amino acid transporter
MAESTSNSAQAARGQYTQELSRSLSLRGNILITLSAVTPASSVFIIIPAVLVAIGGASFIAFAAAAIVGIFMAFCYAELSSAFPIAGGEYSFVARVLGKATGFALFLMNTVSIILIIGVIALGTGEYLSAAFSSANSKWVGVAVIVLSAIVAVLNIRTNAWVTGTFLAVEMAALLVLTLLGFAHVSRPVSTLFQAQTAGNGGVLVGVGLGLVAAQAATALFAYNGYGAAVYFSEETRDAARGIAKAILWSLAITVAAEIIPMTAVILGAPDLGQLVGSASPMQYFVTARGGSALNTIVSLGIALAIINAVIAITLQGGRTLFGSARDRAYPDAISRFFGRVHPRLQTPLPATLFIGGCAAVVASIVPLDALITATGATLVALYLLVALSALVGRRNGTTSHARYRMPAWPAAPVLVIATLGYVTYELWISNLVQVLIAIAALAIGYAYYYGYLYKRRADRWTMPDAPPDEHAVLEQERAELEAEDAGGILAGPVLELEIPVGEGHHHGPEADGR